MKFYFVFPALMPLVLLFSCSQVADKTFQNDFEKDLIELSNREFDFF